MFSVNSRIKWNKYKIHEKRKTELSLLQQQIKNAGNVVENTNKKWQMHQST